MLQWSLSDPCLLLCPVNLSGTTTGQILNYRDDDSDEVKQARGTSMEAHLPSELLLRTVYDERHSQAGVPVPISSEAPWRMQCLDELARATLGDTGLFLQ